MPSPYAPSPELRGIADRYGCDLAEAAAIEALADEIRGQINAAPDGRPRTAPASHGDSAVPERRPRTAPASHGDSAVPERRNAFGFPVLCDPRLYADWAAADKDGLGAIQRATARALEQYFSIDDIAWITEEVLWQIRGELVRGHTVRIPQLGDLTVQLDGTLVARAVPGLALEDGRP